MSRLKRDTENLHCHYVWQEVYYLGITEVKSPRGVTVRLYDKERCICDLIRDKDKVDIQIYIQCGGSFFKQRLQILFAVGKTIGELEAVICLDTLNLNPLASIPLDQLF